MRDSIVVVHHIHHRDRPECASVEGLAARSGIERGAIEIDAAAALGAFDDVRLEGLQVCVGVVEALSHDVILSNGRQRRPGLHGMLSVVG